MIQPYGPEDKSSPVFVGPVDHPVMIVGQNIGHERDGSHTGVVWEDNKSAQTLWEAIGDSENIYLTNSCNYTEMTRERLDEGVKDLVEAIVALEPRKIICLGTYARRAIQFKVKIPVKQGIECRFFFHPSFIYRDGWSKREVEEYINDIRKAIND